MISLRLPATHLARIGAISSALLGSMTAHAGPAPDAALTHVQMRIEVDATGRVLSTEPTSDLPAPLADSLRQHVSAWQFEAPQQEGRAVGGTTFARMSVCAMADHGADSLSVSVGNWENGPGMDPRMLRPSFFPAVLPKLVALGRLEMEVVYEVGADGIAQVLSVVTTPHVTRAHRELERAYRKWIGAMRFEPERIDGNPVATRMRMPVTFTWERASRMASRQEIERKLIEASPTCQALLQDRDTSERPQVALDSPFRAVPSS
jgi:hypothetical protein